MGRLMGSSNSNNYGEQIFINKASEYLDDTNIIYWNRQLFGKEFDVCILMPEKGILVVELKGWREENILRIENNDSVIIQTNDGEVSASPQKQARGYRFSIERHIRQNISKFPLVYQMVCLPQVVLHIAAVDFAAVVIAETLHSEAVFQHTLPQRVHDLLQLQLECGAVQLLRAAGPPGMPELISAAPEVHPDVANGTQPLIFFGMLGIK